MEAEAKETRQEAFVRLVSARMEKTLKQLQLIENLGRYPHNLKQTQKVITALREAVDKVEYAFGGEKEKKKPSSFTLDDLDI